MMVMVKHYIDTLSWDDIAKTLDLKMRTVLKFHGKALPRMRRILLTDGLVALAVEAESEFTATQVSVGCGTDEEEQGEYFNA